MEQPTPGVPFRALLDSPSGETYRAVADALFARSDFGDAALLIRGLQLLGSQGRFAEVVGAIEEALPIGLLSPRLHLLASQAHRELGHRADADLQQFIAYACVKGASDTGDGSQGAPFVVTGVGDEYDVLGFLGKRSRQQYLREDGGRHYDVHTLEDGSELWFDVEGFLGRAPRFDARDPE